MLTTLAQLSQRWDTTTWILLCVAAMATMYVMYRSRRRWKDPLSPKKIVPSAALSPAQQRAVERQMQELLVELSEMSRQITGQLDTRAAKLEILIRQADERIAKMSGVEKIDTPSAVVTGSAAAVSVPDGAPANSGESTAASDAPQSTAPIDGEGQDEIVQTPSSHRAVYLLADEGKSLRQIADQLERPYGEIELILALRSRTTVEESKSA